MERSCLETVVWTFVDAAAPGTKEERARRSGRIKLREKNQQMAEGKRGWRSREKFWGREEGGSTVKDPRPPKRWVLCQCILFMLISVGLYLMLWSLNQNLFIDVYLIYHVVLVSDVWQSDSDIYIYIYIYIYIQYIYTHMCIYIYITFLSRFFCIRGYYRLWI